MDPINSNQEFASTLLENKNLESLSVTETKKFNQEKIRNLNEGTWIYIFTKRSFDIIFSLLGLILLFPLLCVIAFLIKKEDRNASIFFKQERVGKNGEIFKMYKFRSMVYNAEGLLDNLLHLNEVEGAMFKIKNDPRITKVGKLIRSTSIDELPQLWNVLKGEMSLVGPRPPLVREVESYTQYQKQRLIVIPGCTGLWQATVRNTVGFEEMVNLDLEYIQKKSLLFDLKIIILTIKTLLITRAH